MALSKGRPRSSVLLVLEDELDPRAVGISQEHLQRRTVGKRAQLEGNVGVAKLGRDRCPPMGLERDVIERAFPLRDWSLEHVHHGVLAQVQPQPWHPERWPGADTQAEQISIEGPRALQIAGTKGDVIDGPQHACHRAAGQPRSPQGKLKVLGIIHHSSDSMGRARTTDPDDHLSAAFEVGNWQVDPATDVLTLDGRTVKLEPRTMRLLVALAERPGAVCASDALLDAVWPGVVVTGQSLYQAIGELRSVLKADAQTGEFITTIPRKGYRLVAPVERSSTRTAPALQESIASLEGPQSRTIAVLPFRPLGVQPELSFLVEALLGDLVFELSRQPGLTTIARGTMLSYRGLSVSPRRVAAELNVRYVVDGAITHAGDRISITCELIDASTDAVLASETIDVPAVQWPDLGQRVVGRLVRAWRLEMSEHASRAVDTSRTELASALELAMRAWVELYCRPQNQETNDRAWRWAIEAMERDESVGAAWNAIAYAEWRAAQYGWHEGDAVQLLANAVSHAERATALSPSDPDAQYTLGLVTYTSGQTTRAEVTLRHCLQISSSYAPAYGLLALVRAVLGHPEESAALCERALALSPREPLRAVWHWSEACAASMLGDDEDALAKATSGIAANPSYPACYLVAAVSAQRLGRFDEAARYVTVLRNSAFSSIEYLRNRLPPMRVEPWASTFLKDLHDAGLPQH